MPLPSWRDKWVRLCVALGLLVLIAPIAWRNLPRKRTARLPKPSLTLSSGWSEGAPGNRVTLRWRSENAGRCLASGDWNGFKPAAGEAGVDVHADRMKFNLSCFGTYGTMSRSVTISRIGGNAPRITLTAERLALRPGERTTLRWRAENAAYCRAAGDWQGPRGTDGSEATTWLGADAGFALICVGNGRTVRESVAIAVKPPSPYPQGLDFPSNYEDAGDVRFEFKDNALPPMYPATYIWRIRPRRQAGYYTTFFRGPDGPFTGESYYGCHPYPSVDPKPSCRIHRWELSLDRDDIVDDANGWATSVEYGVWKQQALRVSASADGKIHEFFWDLPDTTKVIRRVLPAAYGEGEPENPALCFGDAPWAIGGERLSGVLRGIQVYSTALALPDLLREAYSPQSTAQGAAGIWYLNLDPVPGDISDHSGRGHHPAWTSSARAKLWTPAEDGDPAAGRIRKPGLSRR